MRIIIAGINGFIGSHIAQVLSKEHTIVGLMRSTSTIDKTILNDNISIHNYGQTLKPCDVFINCAWSGVTAKDRMDWDSQTDNINLTKEMLKLAKKYECKHFISFGSQAEYGAFEGRISEVETKPNNAYSTSKCLSSALVYSYCTENNMTWNWLRLFSVYGEREGKNWFIPSVITNALQNKSMEFTKCEQRYDYLPAPEIGEALKALLSKPQSGVFNLTSNSSITLMEVIEFIKEKTNTTAEFKHTLEYRPNQVMHMEGDSTKFYETFNYQPSIGFGYLNEVIKYYETNQTKA